MCDLDGRRVQDTAHRRLVLEFYGLRATVGNGTVSSIRPVRPCAVVPLVDGRGKSTWDEFADERSARRQVQAYYRAQ